MSENTYRDIFLKTKELYKKIGVIKCPALDNNPIHFNSVGFTHLIRKGKDLRPISDQIRRFKLLPSAVETVSHGKMINHRMLQKTVTVKNNKIKIEKKIIIHFWTLLLISASESIKVVIIQEGNGQKNFLSIM